jgi:hypothetical protein
MLPPKNVVNRSTRAAPAVGKIGDAEKRLRVRYLPSIGIGSPFRFDLELCLH